MTLYAETYENGVLVEQTPLPPQAQAKQLLVSELNDKHQLWLEAIDSWGTSPTPEKWAIVRDMLRWILLHDEIT